MQYFEVIGSRAIYKDGWWACARLDKAPWDFSPATLAPFAPGKWDPEQDKWELYYLPDDFTQAKDLAAENPEKLAELKELFWQEAERNRALPLLGSICVFFGILPPLPTITRYTFAGDVQNVQKGLVPRVAGRSYAIEAELEVPEGGAEGVILANADFIGGFGLWVDGDGKLNHTYSFLGVESYRQTSTEPIPTGDVTVKMLFEADEPKPGTGGNVTLWADDKQIGEGRVEKTAPMMLTSYAGMDVSRDNGLVVDLDYEDKAPYPFTGTVKKVVFDLKPAEPRGREGAARAREHPRRRARSGRIGSDTTEGGEMAIGPVQLLVLGFDHPEFHGEIIEELEKLRESDTVRVIDALAVHKDAAGRDGGAAPQQPQQGGGDRVRQQGGRADRPRHRGRGGHGEGRRARRGDGGRRDPRVLRRGGVGHPRGDPQRLRGGADPARAPLGGAASRRDPAHGRDRPRRRLHPSGRIWSRSVWSRAAEAEELAAMHPTEKTSV